MTLKEEVAKQIKFDFLHQDMNDSYISIAEKILKIIESKIDKKIELIDNEVLNPEFIALNDCMGCIQEKKKAYLEMKDILKK